MRLFIPVLALTIAFAGSAAAQTQTVGTVKEVRTGWNADSFAVVTAEATINPAKCPTPDGYLSDMSEPGYRTYYAAALTAFLVKQPVVIIVDQHACAGSRPKLIGIDLRNDLH